ncbi:MAG: tRNA threonylcarbamoyladenosine dehydratase [Oscillospiraceae bacterium]|nr:tRNA threonylcarbamoyladenosine dehydratase [Oscillospiraceae bacterium]
MIEPTVAEAGQFDRIRMLLGESGLSALGRSRVALFGVGGVGSYAAEALARSGVGAITLIDGDRVALSDINRQLHATHATLGRHKVDAMGERLSSINPRMSVTALPSFYGEETAGIIPLGGYSYVVDAIDSVRSKVLLAVKAQEAGVPIICCLGAGNRLDPLGFAVADIFETDVCPLARAMRKALRKAGVGSLRVVYSREAPIKAHETVGLADGLGEKALCGSGGGEGMGGDAVSGGAPSQSVGLGDGPGAAWIPRRGHVPGSAAFVTAVAGMALAAEVVRDLASAGLARP